MKSKIIIGLILVFSVAVSCRTGLVPLWTVKTYSFAKPELQIDSAFLANLNISFMDSIIFNYNYSEPWRHFDFYFKKEDSLNYCLIVSLSDFPSRNVAGFIEYDKYLYWFGGNDEIPPNIILGTKSEKQFSSIENIYGYYDPPFWSFTYNHQTGSIEVKEKDCF